MCLGFVNVLLRSFVYLFDCDCIVCDIWGRLFGGIDCCVRSCICLIVIVLFVVLGGIVWWD